MPPRLRKFVLTLHVATSVGWLGAVVAYIALDITAVSSGEVHVSRAAYLMMNVTVWYAIVPLALASVVIGTVNALGTTWGLVRHYWVLAKFLLTIFATVILLVETRTVRALADVAASGADPRQLPGSLPHSIGGMVLLLVILALSVYKPRGMTRYGWRRQQKTRVPAE
ncbi:membrane protein [Kibdelosporangium aridum]|uniref:membrane protein n=1 Tax=Kibdelosporangium aridum TaxID=2030 RepID=UPI000524360A